MSCTGVVKSFNDTKGWGFIVHEETDVFLHVKDCTDGRPQVGDTLSFDIEEDGVRAGQKKASNIAGCTAPIDGGKGKGKGKVKGTGSCQGKVKRYNDSKGWGFIDLDGQDIFLHVKDCKDGRPQEGDWVCFDVEEDSVTQTGQAQEGAGKKKASNVTGCTGWAHDGMMGGPMMKGGWCDGGWKGDPFKGGCKGYGKPMGYGPTWDGGWGGKGCGWGGPPGPYGKGGADMWGGCGGYGMKGGDPYGCKGCGKKGGYGKGMKGGW